jgi:acetyl esterase/lipase
VLSKAQKKDEDYIRQVSIQEMIGQYAFPELFLLTTPTDAMLYDAVATLHRKLEAGKVVHRYKEYVSDERELQHVFHAVDPELPESMKANEEILQFYREYL